MLDEEITERYRWLWGFTVVLVEKKDGSKRLCVDFWSVNEITKSNGHHLPVIYDILTSLYSASYSSQLLKIRKLAGKAT